MDTDRAWPGDPTEHPLPGEHALEDDEVHLQRERYQELLQELRIILPGVQVLFALVLTAPFAERFTNLDRLQLGGYVATLSLTALSSVLFMAPVIDHRISHHHDRRARLQRAIALKLAGTLALGLAMETALLTVVSFAVSWGPALALGFGLLVAMILLWAVLPLRGPGIPGADP